MSGQQGLLEKAGFVSPKAKKRGIRRSCLTLDPAVTANVRLGGEDELLENTLANNVKISEPLTKREAEILEMIISGKTNKEIAGQLCRTQRTVEYHRNRLMRKLGAHNAAELVKHAIAMGIA